MNTRQPTQEQVAYFDYLKRKSPLASFYRKFFLYPRLARHLSGRVIDIGCGMGDFLKFRSNTVGVDINPLTVDYCQKQGLNAVRVEGIPWPFEGQSFDGAVLDNVLEHLPDPGPLLSETKRLLKKGGTLLIGVPGRKGYDSDPDHKIFYDRRGLAETARHSGFDCLDYFGTPLNWDSLENFMRQYCLYGVFTFRGSDSSIKN